MVTAGLPADLMIPLDVQIKSPVSACPQPTAFVVVYLAHLPHLNTPPQ
jgi:hypothetical protein